MIVTGVQAAGSKGVSAVQVAAVDAKEVARAGGNGNAEHEASKQDKAGEPQPIVFPRAGLGGDQRPPSLRHQQAAERYRADGNPERQGRG